MDFVKCRPEKTEQASASSDESLWKSDGGEMPQWQVAGMRRLKSKVYSTAAGIKSLP